MIVTKKLMCLKEVCSKDALRAVLTGIHYDPVRKFFEATNSVILARYTPCFTEDGEDYPFRTAPIQPLDECIINPEIFEVLKQSKKNTAKSLLNETMLIDNIPGEEAITCTINGQTNAVIPKLFGKYPATDSIWPSDERFLFPVKFGVNLSQLELMVKAFKQVANPVTHFVEMQVSPTSPMIKFNCEDSNCGDKLEGLMMQSSRLEEGEGKFKPEFVVTIKYRSSTESAFGNPMYNNHTETGFESIAAARNWLRNNPMKVDIKLYGITARWDIGIDQDCIYVPHIEEPKDSDDIPLTDEEANALNELTDGDGSSDSVIVKIKACIKADESIQDEPVGAKLDACDNDCDNCTETECSTRQLEREGAVNIKDIDDEDKFFEACLECFNEQGSIQELCINFNRTRADVQGVLTNEIDAEYLDAFLWPEEDREKLEFLFKAGKTIEDLIEIFMTEKEDIEIQLDRMGLIDNDNAAPEKLTVKTYEVLSIKESKEDPYPNNKKRWTREDEEKLEFLWKAGKTLEDLSEIFGRKEKGIETRLHKLGLIEMNEASKIVCSVCECDLSKANTKQYICTVCNGPFCNEHISDDLVCDTCLSKKKPAFLNGKTVVDYSKEKFDNEGRMIVEVKKPEPFFSEGGYEPPKDPGYYTIVQGTLISSKTLSTFVPPACKWIDVQMNKDNIRNNIIAYSKASGFDLDSPIIAFSSEYQYTHPDHRQNPININGVEPVKDTKGLFDLSDIDEALK